MKRILEYFGLKETDKEKLILEEEIERQKRVIEKLNLITNQNKSFYSLSEIVEILIDLKLTQTNFQ